jgi:3',5'-cyclic AMP phosphodiesterase CpdA
MHTPDELRQVVIVHLSDLHFGEEHRFSAERTATGDRPADFLPTCLGSLLADLDREDPGCPVIICITGDLVETGSYDEFRSAKEFVKGLTIGPVMGQAPGPDRIFVVPGNHDLKWDTSDLEERWQQYSWFLSAALGPNRSFEDPYDSLQIYDALDDAGVIVACINSAMFVRQGEPDEQRGRLDTQQLAQLEARLGEIPPERLKSAVRIALMHHHPILIPDLAEAGRGYDAIHNSGPLLTLLRRFGFQLILHGHKHDAFSFTDDVRPAFRRVSEHPIMVVAGGSAGSRQLPTAPTITNSYNIITVKWHASARQTRMHVETRALVLFDDDHHKLLSTNWHWRSADVSDRTFQGGGLAPRPADRVILGSPADQCEAERVKQYEDTRGNFPVVRAMPSLVPQQAYEARVWIEHHAHPNGDGEREDRLPEKVEWCAGHKSPTVTVRRKDDARLCAAFNYWGPMLVQANMHFRDGHSARAYAYLPIPRDYEE